jgi:hypothetical protein
MVVIIITIIIIIIIIADLATKHHNQLSTFIYWYCNTAGYTAFSARRASTFPTTMLFTCSGQYHAPKDMVFLPTGVPS